MWAHDQGGRLELTDNGLGPNLAYEPEEVPAGKKSRLSPPRFVRGALGL